MSRRAAACLIAAGAAVAVAACHRETAATGPVAAAVTVEAARSETLRDTIRAAGTLVPAATTDLTIYASEPARIAELPKKEQDPVAVGDLLVRFEIPSRTQALAALQLDVLQASARADKAQAELTRQTALSGRGLTPRNVLDASRRAADAARAALTQAQASLDTMRATPDQSVVTAHFAGTVLRVWHAAGDTVAAGSADPVMRVIDPSRVDAIVQIPTAQLARVVLGQTATVTALGEPAGAAAFVVRTPSASDPSAPMSDVRLSFAQPTALPLDTAVAAEILIGERVGAVTVPAAAVGRDDLGSYLMVAGDDGRAHRRDVRVGLVVEDRAQIATGLAAGDVVIVSGLADLADGAPIAPSR